MAIVVLGAPAGLGAGCRGTEAAPHALRAAGLREALSAWGCALEDRGDVAPRAAPPISQAKPILKALPEVAAWSHAIHEAVLALPSNCIPLILGGDHSVSLGSVPALAARADAMGRPFFVLWIDAHPDCHTPSTSISGNLHGLPLAHAIAGDSLNSPFPASAARVRGENVMLLGVREVDAAEERFIATHNLACHSPAAIRDAGLVAILQPWIERIAAVGGTLHVSLDADALDPEFAPGVGTPVPGGLRCEEVAAALSLVGASGLLGSLELVEVNPFLDRGAQTARAMVGLAVSALRNVSAVSSREAAR